MKKTTTERAVLVTTAHRGVFFGYATDTAGSTIKLRAARLCVYWTVDLHGFMGLASHGPSNGCRIGPAADIELRDITSVTEVSSEAVQQWEKAPWALIRGILPTWSAIGSDSGYGYGSGDGDGSGSGQVAYAEDKMGALEREILGEIPLR